MESWAELYRNDDILIVLIDCNDSNITASRRGNTG